MDASALENAESWLVVIWWVRLGAAGLVALGVAMEFGGDWVAKPFEKIVEDARKLELAQLHKQSDDAKLETARLSKDAETAKASISSANARAAEAQFALETLKRPRTLSIARAQFVADTTTKFRGQRYRASVSQAADDGIEFWQSIYAALKLAGWSYIPMPAGQPAAR